MLTDRYFTDARFFKFGFDMYNNNADDKERLAKWIARCGVCSRRAAERLISTGQVQLNGRPGCHTDLVNDRDCIKIEQHTLAPPGPAQYWLFHKPVGIDCNIRANDASSLFHIISNLPQRVFAVGRLDKDSSGLLLLTNDGALCQRLLHPDYYHEKEYRVTVDKEISSTFLQHMANGVSWQLGDTVYHSRPCQVEKLHNYEFRIILTQGLHRQIRYMCKALGFKVLTLCRVRLLNLQLGNLAVGELRPLTTHESQLLTQASFLPQPQT